MFRDKFFFLQNICQWVYPILFVIAIRPEEWHNIKIESYRRRETQGGISMEYLNTHISLYYSLPEVSCCLSSSDVI